MSSIRGRLLAILLLATGVIWLSAALWNSAASRRETSAARAESLAEATLGLEPESGGASGGAWGASCSVTDMEPAALEPS